jgi:hypothetical protein
LLSKSRKTYGFVFSLSSTYSRLSYIIFAHSCASRPPKACPTRFGFLEFIALVQHTHTHLGNKSTSLTYMRILDTIWVVRRVLAISCAVNDPSGMRSYFLSLATILKSWMSCTKGLDILAVAGFHFFYSLPCIWSTVTSDHYALPHLRCHASLIKLGSSLTTLTCAHA